MSDVYRYEYLRAPSAWSYMPRAFLPKKGFKGDDGMPEIISSWKGCKPDPGSVKTFSTLTGIQTDAVLHPLFLHSISFRLLMSTLTLFVFPESIWRILQTRNVIVQRKPIRAGDSFDVSVRIAGHRVVQKGLEIDLLASIEVSEEIAWESTTTFYSRGNYGSAVVDEKITSPEAPPTIHSKWILPSDGQAAFGKLTGDYNGIHLWNWYAKIFGFKCAFSHPQRVLGQILSRLPMAPDDCPTTLEVWIKGPAYYGSNLDLRVSNSQQCTLFSLHVNDDSRPAFVGRYSPLAL